MTDEMIEVAEQQMENSAPVEAAPTKKELDFKALRERAERAEQRAHDQERALQEMKRAINGTPAEQPDEDDIGVDDDLYIEGKQYKKHLKSIKNELKQTKQQLESFNASATELRLRTKYKDFDKIVTAENLALLQQKRPSQFNALTYTPDLYDKGETAYEMIKSWVAQEDYSETDARIEANKSKPRTAASAGPSMAESPLANFKDADRWAMDDTERTLTLNRLAAIKRR